MEIYEIVMSIILGLASVLLVVLTLCQHGKGQGLSGAITGNTNSMGEGRVSRNDRLLARGTMIAGIVLFVVTLVVCTIYTRMA